MEGLLERLNNRKERGDEMKFSNGMWHAKEGYQVNFPQQAYEIEKNENELIMYGPFLKVERRGNTLNNGVLKMKLASPKEDIISVQITHYEEEEKLPRFELFKEETPVIISEEATSFCLKSGNLKAEVGKGNLWGIEFSYEDKVLTKTSGKSMAYILNEENEPFMREQLSLDVGENIYGLGERFTAFIKNGQAVDMWNADGGTDSEQTYKNIPFYISSKGYGVFVNHPEKVSFEVGSESVTKSQFSVPGEMLEYYIIGGETFKDILKNYASLTGKPSLPPAWSFGLWLTTSFTTDYDEETVMSFIDGMIERGIPLSAFHFDCFWMKEFEWCNFKWDERVFKDPKGLLERIHDKGIQVCVWINPYIGQKSPLYKEGKDNGYFVKTGDGAVWQWDMWQARMALVDFTNPQAVKWYKK